MCAFDYGIPSSLCLRKLELVSSSTSSAGLGFWFPNPLFNIDKQCTQPNCSIAASIPLALS